MEQRVAPSQASEPAIKRKNGNRPVKGLWKKVRKPLADSRFVKGAIVHLFVQAMRFIRMTNRVVPGSIRFEGSSYQDLEPGIVALWHGQHLLMPAVYPSKRDLVAMVSRSADAELNAQVIEKFGIEAVRGSGGRDSARHLDKGGAKALIALKKSLVAGKNVCMIADIPHGTPREAGMGIVLLAKLSGRPIFPAALATSRRKVLEKSWDKTTINLPFGRLAIAVGQPVHVASDADDAEMERKRQELTDQLNAATADAYRLVDSPR
ncbi:lysophospholipid acyltransferase family protein [Mesorhizobium sp. SP-1A]|uniref:lysophospholipid acyltransferase family protein n=1 Tax=Mesorhizobium sp. SP-1A TaxID=3077840 RepID=UPI0028F6F513|nr:lysophospholipid acyltransferase family protein [Mesorhizobium sp. SP-1A]